MEHDFSENRPVKKHVIYIPPIIEIHRVGYDGYHYLIVPDEASGRRDRFTVYKIPATTAKRIKIIGRELPLGLAKSVAERDYKKVSGK